MQIEQQITGLDAKPLGRVSAAAGVLAMSAGSAAVWYFDPAKANFLPACPLLSLTGFACPGCGLTRAFHSLLQGHWIEALDFNLMLPVWVVVFGYVWITLFVLAVRGRSLPMWFSKPGFLITFMIVLMAFGVVRNIPVWPFTILFP